MYPFIRCNYATKGAVPTPNAEPRMQALRPRANDAWHRRHRRDTAARPRRRALPEVMVMMEGVHVWQVWQGVRHGQDRRGGVALLLGGRQGRGSGGGGGVWAAVERVVGRGAVRGAELVHGLARLAGVALCGHVRAAAGERDAPHARRGGARRA